MAVELDIDQICEDILNGLSYRAIAQKYNTNLSAVYNFISDEKHSTRARDARMLAADTYADKAESVLIEAEKDMVEITRARELASHYRWKASKVAPKKYGDKLDVTTNGESIPAAVIIPTKTQQAIDKALDETF